MTVNLSKNLFVAGILLLAASGAYAAYSDLVGFFLPQNAKTNPTVEIKEGERLLVVPAPSPVPSGGSLPSQVIAIPLDAQKNLDFSRKRRVEISRSDAARATRAVSGESGVHEVIEACRVDIEKLCPAINKSCDTNIFNNGHEKTACITQGNLNCLVFASST